MITSGYFLPPPSPSPLAFGGLGNQVRFSLVMPSGFEPMIDVDPED
jgi:hypothetical protein